MKKIKKTDEPGPLTAYRTANPNAHWDRFRQAQQGQSYQAVKAALVSDQQGLCAFCESSLGQAIDRQRVEHFHPKSDSGNPAKNWALDWSNLLAVCLGGSLSTQTDHDQYPTPDNLSCDAYKDYLVNRGRLSEACEGYLLDPLAMPAERLFRLNRRTGQLEADEQACRDTGFQGLNHCGSLTLLVEESIKVLNLNCQRLCDARLEVMHAYDRLIKKARNAGQKNIHHIVAERWFSKPWPSFFTTRRYLLGAAAEAYLQSVTYDG